MRGRAFRVQVLVVRRAALALRSQWSRCRCLSNSSSSCPSVREGRGCYVSWISLGVQQLNGRSLIIISELRRAGERLVRRGSSRLRSFLSLSLSRRILSLINDQAPGCPSGFPGSLSAPRSSRSVQFVGRRPSVDLGDHATCFNLVSFYFSYPNPGPSSLLLTKARLGRHQPPPCRPQAPFTTSGLTAKPARALRLPSTTSEGNEVDLLS